MTKSSEFSANATEVTKSTGNLLEDSKASIALQLAAEMKERNISQIKLAELMGTSRSQIARLLDPNKNNYTLETISRAAKFLGRQVRLELV